MTFTFRWNTGKIELAADAVLAMPAAQLSTFIKTATVNREEVKAEIAAFIAAELENYDPKVYSHKPIIERYNKLLAVCEGKKQSKRDKAIMRIVNNVADSRPQWAGVFQDAGKHCVCDGYRMIRSADALDGFKAASAVLDTTKAIGNISDYTVKLVLPTVKELKQDMKIAKLAGADAGNVHVRKDGKRMDFVYDFGVDLPMVNAKYLVDMLEALPECEAFARSGMLTAPIYFVSGEDDGILLPVRKTEERLPAPTVEEKAVEAVEEKPIENPAESAVEEVKEDPAPAVDEVKEAPEVNHHSAPVQDVTTVKNLSQFKKAISAGYAFKIVNHFVKPELAGQIRQPSKIQTNAFYSVVYGEPNNPVSLANDGKGYYLNYGKAGDWDFTGDTIKMYASGKPIWEITFDLSYGIEETPAVTDEKEAADMRVAAVAAVVNDDAAHVTEYIVHYIESYKRGMITEDEAKDALLRYTVPLALPAHVEAAQDTGAVSSVAVINPAFLRACKGRYEIIYNPGYPDTASGRESLVFDFCEVLHKPRYKNSS